MEYNLVSRLLFLLHSVLVSICLTLFRFRSNHFPFVMFHLRYLLLEVDARCVVIL